MPFVTHDIDEALMLADRVIVLLGRSGQIRRDERIELAPAATRRPAAGPLARAPVRRFEWAGYPARAAGRQCEVRDSPADLQAQSSQELR